MAERGDEQKRRTSVRRPAAIASIIALLFCGLAAQAAPADTTHPFLEHINLTTGIDTDTQPIAVDADGNLIVWLSAPKAVAKFDTDGNPVNFTGLGTNMIDGEGGFDCPANPAHCDRVPAGSFVSTEIREPGVHNLIAVDNSGGPADGYIYVANNFHPTGGGSEGELNVFDKTGVYRGNIDLRQAFPASTGVAAASFGISVDAAGVLYTIPSKSFPHIDRFIPKDGNPAHTVFAGQARVECNEEVCVSVRQTFANVAAGSNFVYVYGGDSQDGARFLKYPVKEFQHPGLRTPAISIDFSPPDSGPFGSGFEPVQNEYLEALSVDPANEHVFIGGNQTPIGIEEWDPQNQQVGPRFGDEGCPGAGCRIGAIASIAVDRSGGLTDGRIYVKGAAANQIAVFGTPIPIPDIESISATAAHTTAHLSATIGVEGGPEATDCDLEYGTSLPYASSVPCDVVPPYTSNTEVAVDLGGLFVGGDYHYRFVVDSPNGTNTSRDRVFQTQAVLGVSTDPATGLDPHSAELNGSLDPDGMNTEYRFDYGISTAYTQKTPKFQTGALSGLISVAPAEITGLQPGRTYHYRLVAKNALGTTKGADRTFLVPTSPRISGMRATNLTETSADLNAEIDPLGFETTYYFEYGSTTNYGSSTPVANIGSANAPQKVVDQIAALQPGVTYHYRVVATNQWGTTHGPESTFNFLPPVCPNEHVRQQSNASYLPDCRSYELVSPANAGSVQLFPGSVTDIYGGTGFIFAEITELAPPNGSGLASNPSRFAFIGGSGMVSGLHPPNTLADRYVATRTETGWKTTYPGRDGDEVYGTSRASCSTSMQICIDYEFTGLQASFGGNPSPPDSPFPFVWNVSGKSLGRWPTNLDVVDGSDQYVGEQKPSSDFSHFVFSSRDLAFAPGGLDSAPGSVYDNDVSSNTVQIASLLPNGNAIGQDQGAADEYIKIPAVSHDGSHILMSTLAPGGNVHLYLRVDDAVTYDVADGHGVRLVAMTRDGAKVVFTSPEQLTADDTDTSVDVFIWEEATDGITRITKGNGHGNSDECIASWTGLCDAQPISNTRRRELDDVIASGSGTVYFYSPEQLDPANPGVQNERNLYVYREGEVSYVATFDPGTKVERMQISPDGTHAAFLTSAQLTGYENTSPDNFPGTPTAWQEMYVYDALSGAVLCASCIPSGAPPTIDYAPTGLGQGARRLKDVMASLSGRFMSDDGRVGFATADALMPADTNRKIDVYEFVDNSARLITSGTGDRDTQGKALIYPASHIGFEGISADGMDLYFSTFETLVPQDLNGSFVKFYDARTTGGFPYVPPPLPCTAADECHGDTSAAAPEPQIGTGAALGSSAATRKAAKRRKPRAKAHHKKRQRRSVRRSQHG